MKHYTGVGSRKTPKKWLDAMCRVGVILEECGYVLRSGGADGADEAFARSVTVKEVYVPWDGFNGLGSNVISGACDKALAMAESIHPAWHRCSQGAQKLHGRNIYQVLGKGLDSPSEFLLCWTPNGEKVGGTATAIKLAESNGVKVYNFGNKAHVAEFHAFLKTILASAGVI